MYDMTQIFRPRSVGPVRADRGRARIIPMNLVNAVFELVGAYLAWRNVQTSWHTPPIGVNVSVIAFSALWAVECIPYYVSHGDLPSAALAAVRCAGSAVWSIRALGWRVS